MFKNEAKEAAPMCARVLRIMLTQAPTRGRPGFKLRNAINDFLVHSLSLLQNDDYGLPLDEIFELARETGINLAQFQAIHDAAASEDPKTVGATIVKNVMIQFSLAAECRVVVDMDFVSRDDVDSVRETMNDEFASMQEVSADDMAQMTYQALVRLQAAFAFFLTETARPLPRMLRYRFFESLPTLVMAYKLYSDASRADELRMENKNVHPAFMLMTGKALGN
jgi:prophage DNA circulation protein